MLGPTHVALSFHVFSVSQILRPFFLQKSPNLQNPPLGSPQINWEDVHFFFALRDPLWQMNSSTFWLSSTEVGCGMVFVMANPTRIVMITGLLSGKKM